MLYRLITEQHRKLPEILSRYVDGYTILYGLGFWEGNPESSRVIEIDTQGLDYGQEERIMSIVEDIKTECEQETVLVQTIMCTTRLI